VKLGKKCDGQGDAESGNVGLFTMGGAMKIHFFGSQSGWGDKVGSMGLVKERGGLS